MPLRALRLCVLAVCATGAVVAAEADEGPVIVTATRQAQVSTDLPVSVNRIDRQQLVTGQLRVNLCDVLGEVCGVVAQNRQSNAQNLQLSVRGFGARSTFGVRGVRIKAHGIPGTMPDGQGQCRPALASGVPSRPVVANRTCSRP